jgi:hypothetical protein
VGEIAFDPRIPHRRMQSSTAYLGKCNILTVHKAYTASRSCPTLITTHRPPAVRRALSTACGISLQSSATAFVSSMHVKSGRLEKIRKLAGGLRRIVKSEDLLQVLLLMHPRIRDSHLGLFCPLSVAVARSAIHIHPAPLFAPLFAPERFKSRRARRRSVLGGLSRSASECGTVFRQPAV